MRSKPVRAPGDGKRLLAAVALVAALAAGESFGQTNGYEATFDELVNLKLESACASVDRETIVRDAGAIELISGKLYAGRPIQGSVRALVFKGLGRFTFNPTMEVERKQLARFFDTEAIDDEFSSAVFLFSDSTYHSLKARLNFEPDGKADAQDPLLREALECLSWKKEKYCHPHLMKGLLDPPARGFFWAQMETKRHGYLFLAFDPFDPEEVSLSRLAKGLQFRRATEVISRFPSRATLLAGGKPGAVERQPATVDLYRAECVVEDNLNLRVKCTLIFRSRMPSQQWLPFWLAEKLVLDSARWGDGQTIAAFKKKDNPILWLRSPQPLTEGQICSATVFYHGDIIDKYINWFFVRSAASWYPRTDYWERAMFDVTFRANEKYDLATSCVPCTSYVAKGERSTRVVTSEPYRNFGFTLGYFRRHAINDPRIPRVDVLYSKWSNAEKQVGADVANSLAFCQQLFGPSMAAQFTAAEFPAWYGVAYPGLINLSWITFQRFDKEGSDEMFRAHEVSHQWWGVGLDYETYHDRWLCEGLATFTGLMYMQKSIKDKKRYLEILKQWRDDLLESRKFFLSAGKEPGPIWLGTRNNTSETEGDYDLVVYRKGAWVFHMLRNMMIDLNTMNEDSFIMMMSDFYNKYKGKNASTADFQATAEAHYGEDLGWFFEQWVKGTGMPRYKYALQYKNELGKIRAVLKVKQEGVPGDFRMPVPVEFDFGNNRFARLRVTVQGPMSKIVLPLMPAVPKKVNFNLYQSVLSTAEEVEWYQLN